MILPNRSQWILQLDANNLYGKAMKQPLPTGDFRLEPESVWNQYLKFDLQQQVVDVQPLQERGAFFVVDMMVPKEVHDRLNQYPFIMEKMKIQLVMLSPFQRDILNQEHRKMIDVPKLVGSFLPKHNYSIHYSLLQQALQQGYKVTAVHCVISFQQSMWMADYIDLNTQLRRQAKDDFQKGWFKLANNSVYGKSFEDVTNRMSLTLVRDSDQRRIDYYRNSIRMKEPHFFGDGLLGFEQRRLEYLNDRPMYVGIAVLGISKAVMARFFYDILLSVFPGNNTVVLSYTDTDSLHVKITHPDPIRELATNPISQNEVDFSSLPDHKEFLQLKNSELAKKNKGVVGLMKIEHVVLEEVAAASKSYGYRYLVAENAVHEGNHLKGIDKQNAQTVSFNRIRDAVVQLLPPQVFSFEHFQNRDHAIHSIRSTRTGLSPFDSKRWICDDGISTLAFGHYKIPTSD